MLKLLHSFFLSLSVGIVACLSTAFLCGLYGSMLDKESSFSEMAWLVLICAGAFATPAVILWWAGVNLLTLRYKQNPQFFNRVLLLSAAIALCVSIVFCYLYNDVQPIPAQVVLPVVVATTCISVWLHRSLFFFFSHPLKRYQMYKMFARFRAAVLVLLTHSIALPLLKLVRRPEKFPYTPQSLEALPPGTLGNDLVHYLKAKKLPLLPYYARHDMKHILLQYDTTGEGEVCLQCFMLGNRHLSFPVLATVLYGLVTMPEYYSLFKQAWRRGRSCQPLEQVNWVALIPQSTQQLIHTINNNKPIIV